MKLLIPEFDLKGQWRTNPVDYYDEFEFYTSTRREDAIFEARIELEDWHENGMVIFGLGDSEEKVLDKARRAGEKGKVVVGLGKVGDLEGKGFKLVASWRESSQSTEEIGIYLATRRKNQAVTRDFYEKLTNYVLEVYETEARLHQVYLLKGSWFLRK